MMYTRDDMEYIVEGLVQELIDMKDGSCISTRELADELVYPGDRFDDDLVSEIHDSLMKAARKRGIRLMIPDEYKDTPTELPYNTHYVVYNLSAQEKCPCCGSRNTGRYMYGMPASFAKLQDKLSRGKVHLAGCGIFTVNVDGRTVMMGPKFRCNDCKKDFGKPPLIIHRDKINAEDLCKITEKITFTVVKERGVSHELTIEKTDDGANVNISGTIDLHKDLTNKRISERRWYSLLYKLFYQYHVHEWKKDYYPSKTNYEMGEVKWILKFELEGNRERTFRGLYVYPPYWKELNRELRNVIK